MYKIVLSYKYYRRIAVICSEYKLMKSPELP